MAMEESKLKLKGPWSPVELQALLKEESLRLCDDAFALETMKSLELLGLLGRRNLILEKALERKLELAQYASSACNNPFLRNIWPRGYFKTACKERQELLLCVIPGYGALVIPLKNFTRNALLVGSTGAGKTTYLRLLAMMVQTLGGIVVVVDNKGDFQKCFSLSKQSCPVHIWKAEKLKLALLQPIGKPLAFINSLIDVFASNFHLEASARVLLKALVRALSLHKDPTLANWIQELRNDKDFDSRGYKTTALACLEQIAASAQGVFDYSESNQYELITSKPGIHIIDMSMMPPLVSSLITCLLVNHEVLVRKETESRRERGLLFFLDDSLRLLAATERQEAEFGLNPFSVWSATARWLGLGFVFAVQAYHMVSPVIRLNCETTIIFSSCGEDGEALQKALNLTEEQRAKLFELKPGEIVVSSRGVWPKAVLGVFPEVL